MKNFGTTPVHTEVTSESPCTAESARYWLVEGCRCEKCEDWDGAIAYYRKALAADPQDPPVRYFAHNNLGYSLLQVGCFDEAETYCAIAIAINPNWHNAHKNLGLALVGQGRWLDAALSLAEAARLYPDDPRAWLHLQQLLAHKHGLFDQSAELARVVSVLDGLYGIAGPASKPH